MTSTPGTFVTNPAWSPDGQTIAFVRAVAGRTPESGIIAVGDLTVMPALGGPERIVGKAILASRIGWAPDGSALYFAAPFQQTHAIFVVPQRGGTSERVTDPLPNSFGDFDPAVSADGRQLVFVRMVADFNADLFVVRLQDGKAVGAPRALTQDHRPTSSPSWLPDGTSVVYISVVTSGDVFSLRGIYRVPASGGTPSRLPLSSGDYAQTLALSSSGDRLIYARSFTDYNMYRVRLPVDGAPLGEKTKFGSSTRNEESPTFSPDGKRLAFASNRIGTPQIFVADADGSNAIPLTTFTRGTAGSPKWSPDGERIVFDARPDGLSDVYSMKADGSDLRRLTDNPAEDHVPCYSADGRWIYFRSTRSGPGQLYRMPASGGEAIQMTRNGAANPIASPDGRWIYFSKLEGGVWKIPADGGDEIPVLSPQGSPGIWFFTVSKTGIYYAGPRDPISRTRPLRFRRFADGNTVDLMIFDKDIRLHFSVSADEKWFAWTQLDSSVNDLVLITNFR